MILHLKTLCLYSVAILTPSICMANPYAPAVGQSGSTAIHMDDSQFVGWATGYQNYLVGSNCDVIWQTPEKALGKAVGTSGDIACLGNGGQITLTFDPPITNGSGFDFALFENSFSDAFLELAYVEVSSNGIDFFRFPNDSLTDTSVSGFGTVDPTAIDGFGGKYRQGYGTPFDLEQLSGVSPLLDAGSVAFVRTVDIIGDGTYLDTSGDAIYDPHPTAGAGGFDLDAIGVINTVPEPGSLALCASVAVSALLIYCRRRNRS